MNSIFLNLLPLLLSPAFIVIVIAYYYDYKKEKKYMSSGFQFILWFIIFSVIYFWITRALSFDVLKSILAFGVLVPLILVVKGIVNKRKASIKHR